MARIQVGRVTAVRVTQSLADGILPMRYGDQMHVVGHETISGERTLVQHRVLADETA